MTNIIIRPDGRRENHTVFNEERVANSPIAIFVGAHPDDDALLEGVDLLAIQARMALIYITLTNGGGRDVEGYTRDTLPTKRIEEEKTATKHKGGVMVVNLGFSDGNLSDDITPAVDAVGNIVGDFDSRLRLIFTLFHGDPHPDHAAAYKITTKVFGGKPIYEADTVTMKDKDGKLLNPTHYVLLTEEEKQIRDEAYRLHKSQTTNLPPQEMLDVQRVVDLPMIRGQELAEANEEYPYAAALTLSDRSAGDNLPEIVGKGRIVFKKIKKAPLVESGASGTNNSF